MSNKITNLCSTTLRLSINVYSTLKNVLINPRIKSVLACFCDIYTIKLYLMLASVTNGFAVCRSFKAESLNVVLF